jgi:hypothetical protein
LVSALAGDRLGYGPSVGRAWRALARRPARGSVVPYPGCGPLRLFTLREVAAMLAASGLAIERAWGIHMLTNVIPSTALHPRAASARSRHATARSPWSTTRCAGARHPPHRQQRRRARAQALRRVAATGS